MRLDGSKEWNRYDESAGFAAKRSGRFNVSRQSQRTRLLILSGIGLFMAVTLSTVLLVSSTNTNASQPIAAVKTVKVEKPAPIEMVDVLVPVKEIEPGKPLDPALFMRVKRARVGLPPDAILTYDDLTGQFARSLLPAHQPIVKSVVTNRPPQNQVIENIPEGHRAITISTNATSAVEGWARAGAHVDVHWITDVLGEKTANLIVQNAKVLSAERQFDPRAEPNAPIPTTVTLLTNERDAQKVLLASTGGQIVLALRGASDSGKATANVTTMGFKGLLPRTEGESHQAEGLEGVVSFREADGERREFAVYKGRIMRRVGDANRR